MSDNFGGAQNAAPGTTGEAAPDGEMADYLLCTEHDSPVTYSDGVIKHWDGGYCSSSRFTTEFLSRQQAGTLLRLAAGQQREAGA